VHAPQVWEARKWGVPRRGWGGLLERVGELPQLEASDVVACVSDEVAHELGRLQVPADRIIVSPMAVDTDRFVAGTSMSVRRRHDLGAAFVVGWIGTFRGFHGLDTLLEAFALLRAEEPGARLLLVGEGSHRAQTEADAERLGISAGSTFVGSVAHPDMPGYIRAMDVAVVSAQPDESFHYSPLKLREYLACARATVAPRLGDIPRTVRNGTQALLYETGDARGLFHQLDRLRADPRLRSELGDAGRRLMVETGTWHVRLMQLLNSDAYLAARRRLRDRT